MSQSGKRVGRGLHEVRRVEIVPGFHRLSEGSVLYRAEGTVILITASVDDTIPKWMEPDSGGWLTAEYQMHPRSNPVRRERRDGRERPLGGRATEIQRLVGRALRSSLDLAGLGERTIVLDCDVLEADGGTRTASITGGWVALVLALHRLRRAGRLGRPVVRDQVAAVSVGHVAGEHAVDLCYEEDSAARVDLNVVATAAGRIVEIQGTAEGEAVSRSDLDAMTDLALEGIGALAKVQLAALADAGVSLEKLTIR